MKQLALVGRGLSKLSWSLKLSYATGQAIEAATTQIISTFLLFYLTIACGMSGALAGVAVAIGIVVDAMLDPLIGSMSDMCRSRLGRRLPFMLVGVPACAVCFVLLFSVPAGWGNVAIFIWVALFSSLLRIAMATFTLTYQAAGAEITDDAGERGQLVAGRFALGILSAIAATLVGFKLYLGGPGDLSNRDAYHALAITMAVSLLVLGASACWAVWKTRHRQHAAPTHGTVSLKGLWGEMRELFSNPNFRVVFAGALLMTIGLGIHGALQLHVQKFLWRLTAPEITILSLTPLFGMLVGAPLAGPLFQRFEKRTLLIYGFTAIAAVYVVPVSLRLLGLLDLHGMPLVVVLGSFTFFACIGISVGAISLGAILADTADEHEHMHGVRREALLFASWSFASKCSAGIGTLLAGLVLQGVNLPKELPKEGALPQATDSAINVLALVQGPVAGLLMIGAIIAMWKYRLTRRKHALLLEDLELRRSQKTSAAAECRAKNERR